VSAAIAAWAFRAVLRDPRAVRARACASRSDSPAGAAGGWAAGAACGRPRIRAAPEAAAPSALADAGRSAAAPGREVRDRCAR